jgi:hypothetical protein
MRLISWKPLAKGSLRGFATVELLPLGLRLVDCPVLATEGRRVWAALPSKPQLDKYGRQKTDINGYRIYIPTVEWKSRELADHWSAAVVALVRQAHPDDLDGSSDG